MIVTMKTSPHTEDSGTLLKDPSTMMAVDCFQVIMKRAWKSSAKFVVRYNLYTTAESSTPHKAI